jgi:hypothetical protein
VLIGHVKVAPLKDSISWSITTSNGLLRLIAFTRRAISDLVVGCVHSSLLNERGQGREMSLSIGEKLINKTLDKMLEMWHTT